MPVQGSLSLADTPLIYLTGPFKTDQISGRVYNFNTGQGLPVHIHPITHRTNHITIIAQGSFVLSGRPAIEDKIIKAGDVLDWIAEEPHGFTALEDNSILIQINKTG